MNRSLVLPACLLVLAACKPPEETQYKAIVGAVLIDPGSPLISRSVLVTGGSRIRAVGTQGSTPIPASADKVDGSGKFLVPAPVPIPDTLPKVSTLAEAQEATDNGATALAGMVADTMQLDQAFIQKLRDLRVVFVPRLASMQGSEEMLARARENTRALAAAGIAIAADKPEDWRLLSQAGLTPEQVLAAATHNAALAARQDTEFGSLQPGFRADIWLLKANPLEDVNNLSASQIDVALKDGEWVD